MDALVWNLDPSFHVDLMAWSCCPLMLVLVAIYNFVVGEVVRVSGNQSALVSLGWRLSSLCKQGWRG